MTDNYDHVESTGEAQDMNEHGVDPMEMATDVVTEGARDGRLAMLGGGTLLLSTLRSIARGQWQAVPKAALGAGLLGVGLRQHRSSGASTFEPSTDEISGGTEGKTESDEAHASRERPDSGQESQFEGGSESDEGSRIEFTDDDEPRSKSSIDADEEDPRRNDDDTDGVEIDVSEPAMADEASEATGPDPEQAQPTQTDATEPEETPDEDASDMKVEPDEDDAADDEVDEDEDET